MTGSRPRPDGPSGHGHACDPGVRALAALLSPVQAGADRYLAAGRADDMLTRTYGGQVVAQSLAATGASVGAGFVPQSLHGYFVRPGRLGEALDIRIERVRDGRAFATRRATATQDGKPVFVLNASFHVREPGEEYQIPAPSGVAVPDSAPDGGYSRSPLFAAFDVQEVIQGDGGGRPRPGQPVRRLWIRARAPLPDDPLLHASVFAYVSDMGPVTAAYVPIGVPFGIGTFTSLSHGIWFHRPVQMDDWVLIDNHVVSSAGSRSLVHGLAYSPSGELVASFTQEVLVRTGLAAAGASAAADA